jgi:SsrA-binding protein
MKNSIEIKNKKADFQYFLFDTITAGLQLTGTEIKSIRAGKVNIADAYCQFKGHELFVVNMHIAEYSHGNIYNHDPRRDRKLLMNIRELRKMHTKIKEKGYTIIPILLFINEEGKAKLNISLARGKKMYDKRETIKEKDNRREMEREEH